MLKAILSYSKKIPVEGQEYSSQSYHLSMETELPDSLRQDEVRAQIHETFELVKRTVEAELSNGNGVKTRPANDSGERVAFAGQRNPNARATNKQISYMCSLAEGSGIGISELNAQAGKLYGVTSLYELKKTDATKLIDSLKDQQKAA